MDEGKSKFFFVDGGDAGLAPAGTPIISFFLDSIYHIIHLKHLPPFLPRRSQQLQLICRDLIVVIVQHAIMVEEQPNAIEEIVIELLHLE